MAAVSWNGGGGNWSAPRQWSTGNVPGANDDVTVGASGSYAVLVNAPAQAHSLRITASGAKVSDTSTLTIGTTLALTNGVFSMAPGALLQGGTIVDSGGAFSPNGGTLQNVAYDGTLDLSANSTTLNVIGSMAFASTNGQAAGTVLLTGSASALTVIGTGTLSNATIYIGDSAAKVTAYDQLTSQDIGSGGVLTLATTTSLVQTGTYAALGDSGNAGDGVVNVGTIIAGSSGSNDSFVVTGASFANQGGIQVLNGAWMDVNDPIFTNTGTVTVGAGSTLEVDGSLVNTGSITVAGELDVFGATTGSSLNGIKQSGGTVNVTANVANAGGTLTVGGSSSLGVVTLSGTIAGGIVHDAGAGFNFVGGTLAGVGYQGALDMSAAGATVSLAGGFTATGGAGTGAGKVLLTGQNATLNVLGNTTLAGMTIDVGNANGYSMLNVVDLGNGGVLTLGADTSVIQTGADATLQDWNQGADGIVNLGTIEAGVKDVGGFFYVGGNSFTNAGTIAVANGGLLSVQSANIANSGVVTVASGSTLEISGSLANTGAISVAGTLDLFGSLSSSSLNAITLTGGTIELGALLNNAGATLNIGAGSALGTLVMQGGTISGGTVHDAGGGLAPGYATLNGVRYQGPLDLSTPGSNLSVTDGITVTDLAGGPGTILLTGAGSRLSIAGTTTLSGVTIDVGSWSNTYLNAADLGQGGMLTLAADTSIVQTGYDVVLGSATASGDGIVNNGTIVAGVANLGGNFLIGGASFTNAGVITLGNGGAMDIAAENFANSGTLTVAAGSAVQIDGSLIGGGTMNVAGALTFDGAATTAQLAAVALTGTGSLAINGVINNASAVFGVGAGTSFGTIALGGTILGGIVWDGGAGLTYANATLDGVAYRGVLDLSGNNANVTIADGITVTDTSGIGVGTIALTGVAGELNVQGTTTLSGMTIDIGNGLYGTLNSEDMGAGASLTFAADTSLVQTGYGAFITGGTGATDAVVNNGTIIAASAGGYFDVFANAFNNNGQITVGNNESMLIVGTCAFSNTGGITVTSGGFMDIAGSLAQLSVGTLTAGTYEVDAGSTLMLPGDSAIAADNATIILSGAGSTLASFSSVNYEETPIDQTLTSIGVGGTLELLQGRGFAAAGSFNDNGLLQLGGSVFSATALTIGAGATLTGSGTVQAPITNAGSIVAAGGTLVLGAVSGGGSLVSGNAAVLNLTVGGALSGSVTGGGTLQLDGSTPYTMTGSTRLAVGAVQVDAGVKLSGSGTINAAVINAGTLSSSGGTLTVTGAVTGGGTISATTGTTLNLLGGGSFAGNMNGLGTVNLGNGFRFAPGAKLAATMVVQTGTTTVGDGSGTATNLINIATATYDLSSANGPATLAGDSASSFNNSGLFETTGSAAAKVAVAFINRGTVQSGSTPLTFAGSVTNSGTILDNGTVLFNTQVSGTGTVSIGNGASATFNAGAASSSLLQFLGATGALALAAPQQFAAAIKGFGGSDSIDLLATKETGCSVTNNVLTVTNSGGTAATLNFSGSYTASSFAFGSDGNGGTLITFAGGAH